MLGSHPAMIAAQKNLPAKIAAEPRDHAGNCARRILAEARALAVTVSFPLCSRPANSTAKPPAGDSG